MEKLIKHLTDIELMSAYQQGEEKAFIELYERYSDKVLSYLKRRVKSEMVADLYQDIFGKLHEKKHLFQGQYPFAPWFFTLIRHHLIDVYRSMKAPLEVFQEEHYLVSPPESEFHHFSELNLSSNDQSLLYKKFVEGKDYKELERELGASSASLRKKVSRLIKDLRSRRIPHE